MAEKQDNPTMQGPRSPSPPPGVIKKGGQAANARTVASQIRYADPTPLRRSAHHARQTEAGRRSASARPGQRSEAADQAAQAELDAEGPLARADGGGRGNCRELRDRQNEQQQGQANLARRQVAYGIGRLTD